MHTHSARCRATTGPGDPTNTRQIRKRFLRAVRKRFRRLRGLIRETVDYPNDALGLASDQLAEPKDVFRFDTDEGLIREFVRWLRDAVRDEILETTNVGDARQGKHWTGTHIRAAYGRGWENATSRLAEAGVDVGEQRVQSVFDLPVPRRQVRRLYTRTYGNLRGITADVATRIRPVLADGLAEGVNPRVMATRLTREIHSMQRTRAETLARTEIINSYSEATLDRYENAGVSSVVHGEWSTADDDRVCPICQSLDGKEYSTDEMRNGTFEYESDEDEPDSLSGTYPLKPPAHPNGRCVILPSLT